MRNIALRIEYDGTDFVGSQWQSNGRTVQGVLEAAWQDLTQERQRVTLAGRTDAGVHARGQVANIRTRTEHDIATVVRGMNAILPEDVGVLAAWEVDLDFHARHTAVRREYRYLIDNGSASSPLLRRNAHHVARRLDADAMHHAAQALVGRHDFAVLTDGPQEGSTVRVCYQVSCQRTELWGQPMVVIEIAANAFLRHMVRKIVGMLTLVGEGRRGTEVLVEVLRGEHKRQAPLAPAHGLYLVNVVYPGLQQPTLVDGIESS
ncbi:MAG: tRNA pseudouridine(38-40) synthase TruA [Roseiflexaceae bacterium]